jgi:hypothetical protein
MSVPEVCHAYTCIGFYSPESDSTSHRCATIREFARMD